MKFSIFYSWQSDLPNSTNRGFIEGELKALAEEFTAEGAIVVEVDRDTAGVAGSPDIGKTILSKIDTADAFVADLSIINSDAPAERKTPNPNVIFELGWAFKSISESRVITVMNTAFGIPEDLPFDLKQRRTVKYALEKNADKGIARRILRDQLRSAIQAILKMGAQVASPAVPLPNPTQEAIDAINADRLNQSAVTKRFMQELTERLVAIDINSRKDSVSPEATLMSAIEATKPAVDDFGTVARAAAEMGSQGALHGLVQGFEYLLARYEFQGTGSYLTADFDLYKFIGHEMITVLAAHLIRAERWALFPELFSERIYFPSGRRSDPYVGVERVCASVELLERLAQQGGRISIHADLLKARHESSPPVAQVAFDDLMAGDLMLSLGASYWFPWSAVYVASRIPRFLTSATNVRGAKDLALALNFEDLKQMKLSVIESITALRSNRGLSSAWRTWDFDPDQISTG